MALKVLITGADGFVGKNIVPILSKEFEIISLVYGSKRSSKNEFSFKKYTDDSVEQAVSQADIVVHLAAMIHGSEKEMNEANVLLTKRLVELSNKNKIKQFIYVSSENVMHNLHDAYTETKRKAEKEVSKFKNSLILRPTVIYGKNDSKYIGRMMKIAKKFPFIPVLGKGKNKFQFLFVEDLAAVIRSAIKNSIKGKCVIAGEKSTTYNEFIELLKKQMKLKKPVLHIPLFILKPIAFLFNLFLRNPPLTQGQLNNLIDRNYDVSKIEKIFKYKATPLQEGLKKVIGK